VIPFALFHAPYASQIDELYLRAGATKWKIPEGQWVAALYRTAFTIDSEIRRLGQATSGAIDLSSLHADDFAFALAFRLGSREGMRHFRLQCVPRIAVSSREISRDAGRATRSVDTVLQRLEGHERQDGCRNTLFEYFDGRVTLDDWLRTLIVRQIANELPRNSGYAKPCPPRAALAAYGSLIRPEARRFQGRPLRDDKRIEIRLHLRECLECQSRLVAIQQSHGLQQEFAASPPIVATRQRRTHTQLYAAFLVAALMIGALRWVIWINGDLAFINFQMTVPIFGFFGRRTADLMKSSTKNRPGPCEHRSPGLNLSKTFRS